MFKQDLTFSTPYMNAAGTLGFAPDYRAPVPWDSFGAFATNPLSLRPRRPTAEPALIEYPGGFLLHTGLPNPGLPAAIKKYARRWADSRLPIIVHLMADRPEESMRMVQSLEGLENIAAVELGFAPLLADDIILLTIEMSLGELPLVVSLPAEQVLSLGTRVIQEGAAAISLAAPKGMSTITPNPSPEGRGKNCNRSLEWPGAVSASPADCAGCSWGKFAGHRRRRRGLQRKRRRDALGRRAGCPGGRQFVAWGRKFLTFIKNVVRWLSGDVRPPYCPSPLYFDTIRAGSTPVRDGNLSATLRATHPPLKILFLWLQHHHGDIPVGRPLLVSRITNVIGNCHIVVILIFLRVGFAGNIHVGVPVLFDGALRVSF